jgi:lipopolysaccharide/colanic/teichoic acid biosynthesis glycosyltransferase
MIQQLVFRSRPGRERLRRVADVAIASAAILLSAPLLLLAAAAIALEDGRPVVFAQKRVGRYGRLFTMYKFRTMRKEACGDQLKPRSATDDRITRVGRILRKTSVDELPELINVLRGEMAIIGPRPEMPFLVRQYERWQHLRHLAKPGVTGLWQATCRTRLPLERPEATLVDLEYIRRASVAFDVAIIAQTIRTLVAPRGVV